MIFVNGAVQRKPRPTNTDNTLEGVALCPYCLFNATSDKFAYSVGNGFHKGLGKCPRCANLSRWKTLKTHWTAKAFAEWCFNYTREGFWDKVKYEMFNDGLRARGILDTFWTRYRELKGDDTETED
jgi:hypothetical protein